MSNQMLLKRLSVCLLGLLVLVAVGTASFAQVARPNTPYGTTSDPNFNLSVRSNVTFGVGQVEPFVSYSNSCYQTGGVALRNRTMGGISVSGCVTTPASTTVTHAYAYWAVIVAGVVPPTSSIRLTNLNTGAAATLTGTFVGSGPEPCWIGQDIEVYRAAIPLFVANPTNAANSKSYRVDQLTPAPGNTDGSDPWVETPVLPLWEGASIVLVYGSTTGTPLTGTVDMFDIGFAGTTFTPPLTTPFILLLSSATAARRLDLIGADGQIGNSVAGDPTISAESTWINGVPVAGPVAAAPDYSGDWNGSSGFPLPQLWDDTGHNISALGTVGTLTVQFGGTFNSGPTSPGNDCLTTVAAVALHVP